MVLMMVIFCLISIVIIALDFKHSAIYVFLSGLWMSMAMVIVVFNYFKGQNSIMEDAVTQIREYISGNQDTRIECDEEGEIYRLFHEVNTLVSILNAHVQNEKKAKKFLKSTISNISHQLKTPLAALHIYNGIMQDEVQNLSTIKEFVSLSEQELDRIETLVKNLLKIAKLDAGTITIDKTIENVADMMADIESRFLFRAKQEEKVMILSGNNSTSLLCDRTWLVEGISNIVKNAFDHTQKGNTVIIEWKQLTSVVQIIIKDNGSGIHREDLHHIFKRFYRSRFSKDTQGVGLGLPLAKAIIEAHKGTIEVDSELGVGTTFIVNLLIPTKL